MSKNQPQTPDHPSGVFLAQNIKNHNNYALIFSPENLKRDGKIINIPLYLIEYLDHLGI